MHRRYIDEEDEPQEALGKKTRSAFFSTLRESKQRLVEHIGDAWIDTQGNLIDASQLGHARTIQAKFPDLSPSDAWDTALQNGYIRVANPSGSILNIELKSFSNRAMDTIWDFIRTNPYLSDWGKVYIEDYRGNHYSTTVKRAKKYDFGQMNESKQLTEGLSAWVSPKGEVYPVDDVMHSEYVLSHPGLFGLNLNRDTKPWDARDMALQNGWLRVMNGSTFEVWDLNNRSKDKIYDFVSKNVSGNPDVLIDWHGRFGNTSLMLTADDVRHYKFEEGVRVRSKRDRLSEAAGESFNPGDAAWVKADGGVMNLRSGQWHSHAVLGPEFGNNGGNNDLVLAQNGWVRARRYTNGMWVLSTDSFLSNKIKDNVYEWAKGLSDPDSTKVQFEYRTHGWDSEVYSLTLGDIRKYNFDGEKMPDLDESITEEASFGWINASTGEDLSGKWGSSSHSEMVNDNREKFGVPANKLIQDGDYADILRNGWIRYYSGFNELDFTVSSLTNKNKDAIYDFVLKHKDDFRPNTPVIIAGDAFMHNSYARTTVDKILGYEFGDGQNESKLTERANDIIVRREVENAWQKLLSAASSARFDPYLDIGGMGSKVKIPGYDDLTIYFTINLPHRSDGVTAVLQGGTDQMMAFGMPDAAKDAVDKALKQGGYVGRKLTNDAIIQALTNEIGDLRDYLDRYRNPLYSTFSHEFEHYLLNKRWHDKGYYPVGSSLNTNLTPDEMAKNYYNDPSEANAYYEQTIQPYHDIATDLGESDKVLADRQSEFAREIGKTAAEFLAKFQKDIQSAHIHAGRYWTPEVQRKMLNRAYEDYDNLKILAGV